MLSDILGVCMQVWTADPATQAVPLKPPGNYVHPCSYDALHASQQEDVDANIGSLADVREALLGPEASKVRICPLQSTQYMEVLLYSKVM